MLKTAITTLFFGLVPLTSMASASILQTTGLVELQTANPGAPVEGSIGILDRMDDGVAFNIDTVGLTEGAYTVWWLMYNNPEFCIGPCDIPDLLNIPEIEGSSFYATGGLVDSSGIGSFMAEVAENTVPSNPDQFLFGPDGLLDSFNAEIQVILRYHGPINSDPEIAALQTTTFNGGCTLEEGDGLFECFDPQIAIFPQVSVPEPSVTFGLIAFAMLGLKSVVKKKR
ncbi:MAG: hypothetical protein QNJ64_08610 [Crocosphaera sp.]|nr:hypothetical protein [Crocosphaera sp.]